MVAFFFLHLLLPPLGLRMDENEGATKKRETPHQVFSFNVLAGRLAKCSWFSKCNPGALQFSHRIILLINIILHQMCKESIICLQEVCPRILERLLELSHKKDYDVAYEPNGWMCTCVLYPKSKYDFVDVSFRKISDWIPRHDLTDGSEYESFKPQHCVNDPQESDPPQKKRKWSYFLSSWNAFEEPIIEAPVAPMLTREDIQKEMREIWDESRKRNNTMTVCRLLCKNSGQTFSVGSFHAPCAWRTPPMQFVFSVALLRSIEDYYKEKRLSTTDHPFILGADMNFQRGTMMYKRLCVPTFHYDAADEASLLTHPKGFVNIKEKLVFKDAHASDDDSEHITIYAGDKNGFKGGIDFIYYLSGGHRMKVVSSRINSKPIDEGPYPNLKQPSDHFSLQCTFYFAAS